MEQKFEENFFFFREWYLNWKWQILPIFNRILALGSQCNKKTGKISPNTTGNIFQINFSQKDENK